MRRLTLPSNEIELVRQGRKTRLMVLAHPEETFEVVSDGVVRILSTLGKDRFVTDAVIRLDTGHQMGVLMAQVTGIEAEPRYLFDMGRGEASAYGYSTLWDLWEAWTQRYDPASARWWKNCKGLIEANYREKLFRKYLYTRNPRLYRAWVLLIKPAPDIQWIEAHWMPQPEQMNQEA